MTMTTSREHPPLLYRVAKTLDRKGIRGSWWLLQRLLRGGALDQPVQFRLSDSTRIVVPIARNHYDQYDLDTYETEFVDTLAEAIRRIPAPVTLLDCGADIGLFSLKMLSVCPSISQIIAFEPNDEGYPWLKTNLGALSIPAEAMPCAVADFEGKGRLAAPDGPSAGSGDPADHAAFFIVPSADGSIPVTTIDAAAPSSTGSLVIKLDLEGGELAALRGAVNAIATASHVIVAIEAHPMVVQRTGIEPVECLRFLASLRPFRFMAGETRVPLTLDSPVFEQIAPNQIYNLICESV